MPPTTSTHKRKQSKGKEQVRGDAKKPKESKSEGSKSKGPKSEGSKSKGPKSKKSKSKESYDRLYCAIYTPEFGNYYHWAFVVFADEWHIFEAAQSYQDGPYFLQYRNVNPNNSSKCLKPIILLAEIEKGWWGDEFIEMINGIPVPGESLSWNCQDLVMEIWERVKDNGIITEDTWQIGYNTLIAYYGMDFGGEPESTHEDEGNEDEQEQTGEVKSEEFVQDSSE